MEHWFDRLAEPHTRRTTLKAGAVGAAALMLPFGRVTSAAAKQSEPCFKPCVEIATTAWNKHEDACFVHGRNGAGVSFLNLLTPSGQIPALVLSLLTNFQQSSCLSGAELTWHRDVEDCLEPECGDPGKYPGGNGPHQLCDPGYAPCNDGCCDLRDAECIMCNGREICCVIGGHCC